MTLTGERQTLADVRLVNEMQIDEAELNRRKEWLAFPETRAFSTDPAVLGRVKRM